MMIRRVLACAAAVMMAGGVTLVAAPAASAADLSIDCAADTVAGGAVRYSVTVSPGEAINITNVGQACLEDAFNTALLTATVPVGPVDVIVYTVAHDAVLGTYTGTIPDFVTWEGIVLGTIEEPTSWITIIVVAAPPTVSGTNQTPPPWLQSYGRVGADEKCLAGWNPSYAMWPNDGKGGWVCDRTLVYNNSTKMWDVK